MSAQTIGNTLVSMSTDKFEFESVTSPAGGRDGNGQQKARDTKGFSGDITLTHHGLVSLVSSGAPT